MNNKKEIVLVDGAAGFLGTSLVELLLSRAEELNIEKIIGLDNLTFKEDSILPLLRNPKFELIIGDVRDKPLLGNLVKQSTVIFPLSAIVGAPACSKHPILAREVNLDHIQTIVDNADKNTKIIFPATNSVYGDAGGIVDENSKIRCLSIYAKTKYDAEQIVLKHGGTSLRLSTLFGISWRQRLDLLVNTMILKSQTDRYVLLYQSSFQRCYISVRDAARGFIHALENYNKFKGQAFNLGNTSLNCSKGDLARKIKEFSPDFVIKEDPYNVDPDARDYIVRNEKIEATGFKCEDSFDVIIPQVIKAYTVLLNTKNYMLT